MTRIGLVQMHCEKAAIGDNLKTIASCLQEADSRGVEILCFPEMSLTGYADPSKYPQAVIRLDGPEVDQLLNLTRPYATTILVGLIEQNPVGKPFITQIVVRQGALLGYYHKITIKDDEEKWFSPGQQVPVFQLGELTYGLALCADIQNETVFAKCREQGAPIVLELAAPGLYGEQATRNWKTGYAWWEGECKKYLSEYARKYGLWIGVATQAGRTVDEDFPGGGYVFAPSGERVYATRDGRPGVVYLELDLQTGQVKQL